MTVALNGNGWRFLEWGALGYYGMDPDGWISRTLRRCTELLGGSRFWGTSEHRKTIGGRGQALGGIASARTKEVKGKGVEASPNGVADDPAPWYSIVGVHSAANEDWIPDPGPVTRQTLPSGPSQNKRAPWPQDPVMTERVFPSSDDWAWVINDFGPGFEKLVDKSTAAGKVVLETMMSKQQASGTKFGSVPMMRVRFESAVRKLA